MFGFDPVEATRYDRKSRDANVNASLNAKAIGKWFANTPVHLADLAEETGLAKQSVSLRLSKMWKTRKGEIPACKDNVQIAANFLGQQMEEVVEQFMVANGWDALQFDKWKESWFAALPTANELMQKGVL